MADPFLEAMLGVVYIAAGGSGIWSM